MTPQLTWYGPFRSIRPTRSVPFRSRQQPGRNGHLAAHRLRLGVLRRVDGPAVRRCQPLRPRGLHDKVISSLSLPRTMRCGIADAEGVMERSVTFPVRMCEEVELSMVSCTNCAVAAVAV